MNCLKTGDKVQSAATRSNYIVKNYLAGGGQGEVYRVELNGQDYALKWYLPTYLPHDPLLRGRLNEMVSGGSPSPHFVWPAEIVDRKGSPSFGYIMPLYEPRFQEVSAYIGGQVQIGFRTLITIALNLIEAFQKLHARGLCYRDISFGNMGFDPANGDICIWDNDNVGLADQITGVGGTKGFIAPEVARGHARPNASSDLFALSALLFQLFIREHPLEGSLEAEIQLMDEIAYRRLHIEQPLFMFDAVDQRNAPMPGWNDNGIVLWPIYPQFFRDIFTKAFTIGLHLPQVGRVTVGEWRRALVRLRDQLFPCPNCRAELFYDEPAAGNGAAPAQTCWSCQQDVAPPPRLYVRGQIVALNFDTGLFPHHLEDRHDFDFGTPLALVVHHPTDPTIAGLRNESGMDWTVTVPGKDAVTVPPGKSVSLANEARINFGGIEGEIRG